MPYADPEVKREWMARHSKATAETRREYDRQRYLSVKKQARKAARAYAGSPSKEMEDAMDEQDRDRRLGALRALLHAAQGRHNGAPSWESRRDVERLQDAVDKLVAGPELERLRSAPLPAPLRHHAPEVPPAAKVETPIWEWLGGHYWTKERRRLYRGAGA